MFPIMCRLALFWLYSLSIILQLIVFTSFFCLSALIISIWHLPILHTPCRLFFNSESGNMFFFNLFPEFYQVHFHLHLLFGHLICILELTLCSLLHSCKLQSHLIHFRTLEYNFSSAVAQRKVLLVLFFLTIFLQSTSLKIWCLLLFHFSYLNELNFPGPDNRKFLQKGNALAQGLLPLLLLN